MSSTTEALATLHKQLDRLLPAVDNIEAARAVIVASEKLPAQQKELLSEHLAVQKRELGDLLSDFRQSLESAEQTVTRLNAENTAFVKTLQQEHAEGMKLLNDASSKLVDRYEEYTRQITVSLEKLSTELESSFKKKNEELTSSLEKQNAELAKEVKTRTGELSAAGDRVNAYQDTIEKIDFPIRLDKLDATISGIMAATQTTQGRVDNLERVTSEKVTALISAMEKQQKELMASFVKANKSTRTLLFVSIVLSIVVLASIAYLLTST
jgi:hypothetical protein